jgi:hypothetical protein
MYKAYSAGDGGAPRPGATPAAREAARQAAAQEEAERAARMQAAAQAAAEEDPLNGPPRDTPRGQPLGRATSEPAIFPPKPIDIFEQRKRERRRGNGPFDEDPNSLKDWLEGMSISSMTTATTASRAASHFSDLTRTSVSGTNSLCSVPGTTNQANFRVHRRAIALNKATREAAVKNTVGELKEGFPTSGMPESDRLQTSFKDCFGSRPLGENITKQMYESVFQEEQHPFVARFLEGAPPEHREQFTKMVRSLEYLRRSKSRATTSLQRQELDLAENSRLWRPPQQVPVFDASERNMSKIPLGTLVNTKKQKEAVPPPPQDLAPPSSPSVSGLGSLPLTRLSTPAPGSSIA